MFSHLFVSRSIPLLPRDHPLNLPRGSFISLHTGGSDADGGDNTLPGHPDVKRSTGNPGSTGIDTLHNCIDLSSPEWSADFR